MRRRPRGLLGRLGWGIEPQTEMLGMILLMLMTVAVVMTVLVVMMRMMTRMVMIIYGGGGGGDDNGDDDGDDDNTGDAFDGDADALTWQYVESQRMFKANEKVQPTTLPFLNPEEN